MTLEQLLGKSADEWEKLSDEELTATLAPYFHISRPKTELIPTFKKIKHAKRTTKKDVNEVLGLVKSLGIEL